MRDARYIQNTENRCLIFELCDKHVGLNFWIAMQYEEHEVEEYKLSEPFVSFVCFVVRPNFPL